MLPSLSPHTCDTGSDTPLIGHSSPRRGSPATAQQPQLPARHPRPRAASPAPPENTESVAAALSAREPGAGPTQGAGPERRALPSAHARSAAARRVHSRRSFQRPRTRRRPALLKLASLQPPGPAELPPHALEQEETPL